MTLVVLLRHAHSTANGSGILAGRAPGVQLSQKGIEQAESLIDRLGTFAIKEIRISPLERCHQTIEPWVRSLNSSKIRITTDSNLHEVDYGKWTGKKLSALSRKREWKTVQNKPSEMLFPEGESIADMSSRAQKALQEGLKRRGSGALVLVSHGDVIKSLIASSLNMALDDFQRIVVDPASITIIDYSSTPRLLAINDSQSNFSHTLNSRNALRSALGGGAGIASENSRKKKR
jgi:probable phosphoglycerate mutase